MKQNFAKIAIILIHLIIIGGFPIFGGISNLYRNYSLAYSPDLSSPEAVNESNNIKQNFPHSIFENGLLVILGLLSIIGSIAFAKNKKWGAITLISVSILFLLLTFFSGFVFFFPIFLPIAFLLLLIVETMYIIKVWPELK